jgi:hypothetical protein
VQASVEVNDDPVRVGCDLLDAGLPPDAARGFPVCRATVVLEADGYAAALGWVQLVRSTDDDDVFKPDPLALFRDVDTPFAFFGIRPTLFDAPFRPTLADLDWTAHSYLCAVREGVMSKLVYPVAAFSWGFTVRDEEISLEQPAPLPLGSWAEHGAVLSSAYPSWTFLVP